MAMMDAQGPRGWAPLGHHRGGATKNPIDEVMHTWANYKPAQPTRAKKGLEKPGLTPEVKAQGMLTKNPHHTNNHPCSTTPVAFSNPHPLIANAPPSLCVSQCRKRGSYPPCPKRAKSPVRATPSSTPCMAWPMPTRCGMGTQQDVSGNSPSPPSPHPRGTMGHTMASTDTHSVAHHNGEHVLVVPSLGGARIFDSERAMHSNPAVLPCLHTIVSPHMSLMSTHVNCK